MQDLNDKITGGLLTALEWNEVPSELQNIITDLGQTLSGSDLDQLGKAIAAMSGSADFYLESGIADAYVCEVIGPKQGFDTIVGLTAVNDGLRVRFRPGNNNTGTSTVNVNGTGIKTIVRENGTTLQSGDLVTERDAVIRWDQSADKFRLIFSSTIYDVRWFGATGDGVTDDSIAIQAAIDAAAVTAAAEAGTRVVVWFPHGNYICQIILKANVVLKAETTRGSNLTMPPATTGYLIDTPSAPTLDVGVDGLSLHGGGAGENTGGVRFQDVTHGFVNRCRFNNFDNEAIVKVAGNACYFEDNLAQNCLLDRTRSAKIGVIDLNGTDDWIIRGEYTASSSLEGMVSDTNLYICAGVIRDANNTIESTIFEISDVGLHVIGGLNRVSNVRCDLNYGHGFEIVGSSNMFSSCLSLSNSQDTNNLYDNWNVSGGNNMFSSCLSHGQQSNKHRYGFNDSKAGASQKNRYVACAEVDLAMPQTAAWKLATSDGSIVHFPIGGGSTTFIADNTTPSVSQLSLFDAGDNVGATAITALDDGIPGQRVVIINTGTTNPITIADSGNFDLSAAWIPNANDMIELITVDGTLWRELSRSAN